MLGCFDAECRGQLRVPQCERRATCAPWGRLKMGTFLLANSRGRTLPSHGLLLESRHSMVESGEMRGMNFGEQAGEAQHENL